MSKANWGTVLSILGVIALLFWASWRVERDEMPVIDPLLSAPSHWSHPASASAS